MISENELRDRSIVFQNSRNVAAELLKTLKRDVPFETEKDILEAHDRLTQALYQQYNVFREATVNPSAETPAEQAPAPVKTPAKAEPAKADTKAVATSEPSVLAMVQKAVDAVSTKDACEELKAKILKATKLSLQDQSTLIAKLEAKHKVL